MLAVVDDVADPSGKEGGCWTQDLAPDDLDVAARERPPVAHSEGDPNDLKKVNRFDAVDRFQLIGHVGFHGDLKATGVERKDDGVDGLAKRMPASWGSPPDKLADSRAIIPASWPTLSLIDSSLAA